RDARTGRVLRRLGIGRDDVRAADFSPDGRTVIAQGWDKALVHEVSSGKVRHALTGPRRFEREAPADLLRVSRDGRSFAAFGPNPAYASPLDRRKVVSPLHRPDWGNAVFARGAISPDGRWLADAADHSPVVRLRDLRGPLADEPWELEGHIEGINDLH